MITEKQKEQAKKAMWESPDEQNQWAIFVDPRDWVDGAGEDSQPPEKVLVYVRQGPPPEHVRVWNGNGVRQPAEEEFRNYWADKPFEAHPTKQPFLFGKLIPSSQFVRYGKLDDESKAMLKEKYNVDVDLDAPVDTATEEEDDG